MEAHFKAMKSSRRVVITGMGAVTPLGNTVDAFWSALLAGQSGVGLTRGFDASAYECRISAEVREFDATPFFRNPKDARRSDRYVQFAVSAARQAYDDSGLAASSVDLERIGVLVGSGIGGLSILEEQHAVLLKSGPRRVSPFMIPMMISNMASGIIAMELGFQGPNFSIASACATSNHAIGEAWRILRDGDADLMLAGGSEAAITPLGVAGFSSMKALAMRNDEPEKASRPFDMARNGFVLGEGSGVVVLEEYEHALRRGAHIHAEIIGYGATADAYHLTSPPPDGVGAARAMSVALNKASIQPEEVDYINAHGTSTPQGDIAETRAIKHIFGEHARRLMISSTKSMIGHLLGAAGAVELVACLKTIQTSCVHPTINLDQPDPECDLDYVPHQARKASVRTVMSNSFGFGGHNACIIARGL